MTPNTRTSPSDVQHPVSVPTRALPTTTSCGVLVALLASLAFGCALPTDVSFRLADGAADGGDGDSQTDATSDAPAADLDGDSDPDAHAPDVDGDTDIDHDTRPDSGPRANLCGGLAELRTQNGCETPGAACAGAGTCACDGERDLVCVTNTRGANACGGTARLPGRPGDPCDNCAGTWAPRRGSAETGARRSVRP